MSQKSPKSSKSPVSNSSSCHDVDETELEENQRPSSALDRLQRQVEEELRQSNRLLVAVDGLIAESKGSISEKYSRPSSAQDEVSPNFRTQSRTSVVSDNCSPVTQMMSSYNEEMEKFELPSPPRSAVTYGSRDRDGSRSGSSKRGSRLTSPEAFSLKSRMRSPSMLTNQVSSNMDYQVDETKCPSIAIHTPSGKSSRCLPSCSRNASKMSCHTPQEQLSFEANISVDSSSERSTAFSQALSPFKDHFRSESAEPQAQPSSCRGKGSRATSPAFASTFIKEIMVAESSQDHQGTCSKRPATCHKTQFPTYDEVMKSAKIGNDCYHNSESPRDFPGRNEKATAALDHLSQLRKTPSYFRCVVQEGTEFLNVCCPKVKDEKRSGKKVAKLPKMPCLGSEDIDNLIKCEANDVESAWYLTSDEKNTYKKPCPKQQKAQMIVKNLFQTYTTQTGGVQIYTPLDHPEPEDISPEMAAAMMFSQEQGIKMEECPNALIAHLFPDEHKLMTLRNGSVSIIDPNQRDQEEIIEKSASVPSEGVSDSAYTRTMRGKGKDMKLPRPYDMDFPVCQSKPEYVLVAQKPQRVNKVQFRGNSPSWFPGYFSAFPDDDGLKVVASPSGLFHKAWVNSNPENIPASDVIVLE